MEIDPALSGLVGSETRLRVLAVLANAQRPLTGYRVAKTGAVSISKAYPELERLAASKLVLRCGRGWAIHDEDVAALLRKRVRIVDGGDWFRDKPKRDAEDRRFLSRLKSLPAPDWSQIDPDAIRFDVARRKEKDELLLRHGMKPSVTHGRT